MVSDVVTSKKMQKRNHLSLWIMFTQFSLMFCLFVWWLAVVWYPFSDKAMYMYICIYVCVNVCICICLCISICRLYVCVSAWACVYVYVCVYAYAYVYYIICLCMCVYIIFVCMYRDLTKSCLSHSFRFPRLWTQHQEVMPKSCLWVFPHSERKRQNNPFQIRTFHFHPFFSSLCLRFTVSSLPTFFPKQVYLYGVLWVAMAPYTERGQGSL